jgi:hypothetical protein
MSAPVRPIYVPGEAARESVRQRAQAALDAWLREWVSGHYDGPHPRLTLQACSRGEREHAYEYSDVLRTKAGCIWFRRNTADRLNFGGAVVGATLMSGAAFVDDWMRAIADQGWDERNRMLCAALLGVPETDSAAIPLPTELLAFGSGAVQVSCDAVGLHAIADRGVWRSVPPSERMPSRPRAALTPLERAAQRSRLRVDAMLGSVEVDLPKLLDLQCGDVLRLPQRLDRGITLQCADAPFARAVLGEQQQRKCVQLTARWTTTSEETS